jgi:non-ribosomal peptide synthetase component E (peptide arylation enzyme)
MTVGVKCVDEVATLAALRGRLRAGDIWAEGGRSYRPKIESAIFQVPQVQEVAIVAYPDERLGERACAIITLRSPSDQLPGVTCSLRIKSGAPQRL